MKRKSNGHGEEKQQLKAAALDAVHSRGANCGSVHAVITALHDRHIIEDTVSVGQLRQQSKRDRNKFVEKYCLQVTLPLQDGTEFHWKVLSPHRAMQFFLDHVDSFERLVQMHTPGKPMQFIAYHDEITPGNPLLPDNRRKAVAFYVSYVDWSVVRNCEHAWLPVAVLRSSVAKEVVGGFSAAFAALIRSWLPHLRGMAIRTATKSIHLTMTWTGTIMDEKAIMESWNAKGAAGKKPCLLCINCISKPLGTTLGDAADAYFHDIAWASIENFQKMSDEDAWEAADHLHEQFPRMNKGAFEELQRNIGFNYNQHGLLWAQDLRWLVKPSSSCFDILHCYFAAGGIVAVETQLFIDALLANDYTWSQLQHEIFVEMDSLHIFPKKNFYRLLSSRYFYGPTMWKASGTEQMALLPFLHNFLLQRCVAVHSGIP